MKLNTIGQTVVGCLILFLASFVMIVVAARVLKSHMTIGHPASLSGARAENVHLAVRNALRENYMRSGDPTATAYQNRRRYNTAPYRSRSHGERFLNNYGNDLASGYGAYEIVFTDPRLQTKFLSSPFTEEIPYTGNEMGLESKDGRMVLFPAWLSHGVPQIAAIRTVSASPSTSCLPRSPRPWPRPGGRERSAPAIRSPSPKVKEPVLRAGNGRGSGPVQD